MFGPSAASAVNSPISASRKPKRIPSRSSLRANNRAATSVTASEAVNTGIAASGASADHSFARRPSKMKAESNTDPSLGQRHRADQTSRLTNSGS
jgi:hypothetical protein